MAALLILLISSLPITAYLLTAQTEQQSALELGQRPTDRDVPAIVILGDGAGPSNPAYRLRSQLSNVADGLSVTLQSRLLYAGQLYAEQRARGNTPLVIVSTGPQPILAQPNVTSTDVITNFLVQRGGVDSSQIRVDTESVDPRSSAVAVRQILSPGSASDNCRLYAICDNGNVQSVPTTTTAAGPRIPVELVTPALGLRRAASTFARLNFAIVPKPTDFYVFQSQAGLGLAALTDLIPSAEALGISSRVVDEYLATVYYFLRGWLTDPLGV
ncbi:MAG: YdcF family protein [Leptolyngbyaceae cyanobacterium CRU_2_3]|nr:YdcF family protein [Leptolyngbyaceae cyanobacterium CRU_2_3]